MLAWLLRSCDSARPLTIARVERTSAEVAAALRVAPRPPAARSTETLAAGLFLEYCRDACVPPLEAHWLLGDAAGSSERTVLPYCVEIMLADALRRRSPAARPAAGRAAVASSKHGSAAPGRRDDRERPRDPHTAAHPFTAAPDHPSEHHPHRRRP